MKIFDSLKVHEISELCVDGILLILRKDNLSCEGNIKKQMWAAKTLVVEKTLWRGAEIGEHF